MTDENKKEKGTIDMGEVVDMDGSYSSHAKTETIDLEYSHDANQMNKRNKEQTNDVVDSSLQGSSSSLISRTNNVHDDGEEAIVQEAKKAKFVATTKGGLAVVDQYLPDNLKSSYHVLEMGDEIYDAMLTQTNVADNSNEFFVMQVLESNDGDSYMFYIRWGTVGVKGEIKLFGPCLSCPSAIDRFEQTFYLKTKNHWSNRKKFVSYPKFHTWLEIDYCKKEQGRPSESCKDVRLRCRVLDPFVAKFMSFICNLNMMTQQMADIGYDAEKLPLKNLSKSTILRGYDVLKLIADIMDQADKVELSFSIRKLLEQLSGEFYTIIPHDFGNKNLREFVIDTPQKLISKIEMVEALDEIEHATRLVSGVVGDKDDLLYIQYEFLRCELAPVLANSKEFSMIEKYLKNTEDSSIHSARGTADIVQIFRVSRHGENESFKKYADTKNRMLLWHGSRLTNWLGILSQGLRVAPPQAPLSGSSFGRGLYFADMFAKSVHYCRASPNNPAAVLLLCEVALGDMQEFHQPNHKAHQLLPGKLSTKGVGKNAPSECEVLEDGVIVPSGVAAKNMECKGGMPNSEYVVYNADQIRMRYIVRVNFNYDSKNIQQKH